MLAKGTISLERVLDMLTAGHPGTNTDKFLILPRKELRQATLLMEVSNLEAIGRLLPDSTLRLLGFDGSSDPALLRSPECIWREGVDTEIFTNSQGGSVFVRRDGYVLQIQAFLAENKVLEVAIRDRRLDGHGRHGKQSPLNHFAVNDEATNGLIHRQALVAELSVHSGQPATYLQPGPLRDFITDPDQLIYPWSTDNPEERCFDPTIFFPLWQEAFDRGYAPWQPALPIKGFARHFVSEAEELLRVLGYHQVETVPAWYNAAVFFNQALEYSFINPSHRDNLRALRRTLFRLKRDLTYGQKSWIVALQNIPPVYLTDKKSIYYEEYGQYYLGGYSWVNSPSSTDHCARLAKPLNEFALPS